MNLQSSVIRFRSSLKRLDIKKFISKIELNELFDAMQDFSPEEGSAIKGVQCIRLRFKSIETRLQP